MLNENQYKANRLALNLVKTNFIIPFSSKIIYNYTVVSVKNI